MMKGFLLLVFTCLTLQNSKGAPTTAVYKFVKCNPADGLANCVTHQSDEIPWSPELPNKLPASAVQDLNAKPVEDERPLRDEEMEGDETIRAADGESPYTFMNEGGSGDNGGSGAEEYLPAWASEPISDTGSGESWMDNDPNKDDSFLYGEAKPTEQDLMDDSLLNL